jgi:hypothetical protein
MHPNYLLNTEKGIFKINIDEDSFSLITTDFSEINFANWYQKPTKYSNEKWFSHQNKIYSLNLVNFDITFLYEFQEEIKSVCIRGAEEIYVLLESSLRSLNQYTGEQTVIMDNLSLVNDVGIFENMLFVTSDLGVHLYDINSQIVLKDFINDEFNKKAFFISKDSLFLGGVNGIYNFDHSSISTLVLKKLNQSRSTDKSFLSLARKNELQLFLGVFILLVVSNIILYKKYKQAQKLKNVVSVDLKSEIEMYIDENINSVNIEALKLAFGLSNNQLYSYLGNVKPGIIIRKKRLSLLKKLRRANASEEEISKQTGFSISYLKKI